MRVFFEERHELKLGIWEYTFKPERPVDYVPGQYVELHIPELAGDLRGPSRTFTLTSLPVDPSITFVTKHFALQTPYKHALQNLGIGNVARIDDAMGDLVLPKSKGVPLVFIAGGIGMASYTSMLKELIAQRDEREVFLFYALRSQREQLFRELTDVYPLSLRHIVLEPNRLSAKDVRDTTPPNSLIYLSGNQAFVEKLRDEFETLGVLRSQIVFDYYDGYVEL